MDEQIEELATRWQEYVSQDHHKDRDCHFYITKGWSYGEPTGWIIEHSAYIGWNPHNVTYDILEEAEKGLIDYLQELLAEYEEDV